MHSVAMIALTVLGVASAPPVASPKVLLALAWGQGPGQVGGVAQALGMGEGVPSSYLVDAHRTMILDTVGQRVLVLDQGAKAPRAIDLVGPGLLDKGDVAVDLAVGKDGDLFIADGKRQDILHLSADGKPLGRLGHFSEIGRLEWAPDGLAVRDQGALKVVVLAADGSVRSEVAHADLEPVWAGGHFLMGRAVLGRAYTVGAMGKDGPTALAKLDPHEGSKGVLGGTIIGTDASDRIYVQVVEGAGSTIDGEWIYRLDAQGQVQAEIRVEPYKGKYLTLRRVYRVTSDGCVVRFATDASGYRLLEWTMGAP